MPGMSLKAVALLLTTDLSQLFGSLPKWARAVAVLGVAASAGWGAHALYAQQIELPSRLEALEGDSLPARVQQLEVGQDTLWERVGEISEQQDTLRQQFTSMREDVKAIRCIVEKDAAGESVRGCIDTGGG